MSALKTLSPTAKGILLMLLGILIFTTMDALAKSLILKYGTLQVVWARYTGQSVIILLLIARNLRPYLRTRFPGLQLIRSLCQFGATMFFFYSLNFIGLAEATAISDLSPVLITLGASLFLGERIGPRRLFGVAMALTGAMIIIRPASSLFAPAALLPLAGAVCYSGYALISRRVGSSESIWTSLFYTALFGTVASTAMVPFVWQTPATSDIPGFLALGVFGTAAQLCVIRSFSLAEASVVAPFSYVGLIFAIFWGWFLFNELPDLWTAVGALVIVAAGLYVWHRETRAARQAA